MCAPSVSKRGSRPNNTEHASSGSLYLSHAPNVALSLKRQHTGGPPRVPGTTLGPPSSLCSSPTRDATHSPCLQTPFAIARRGRLCGFSLHAQSPLRTPTEPPQHQNIIRRVPLYDLLGKYFFPILQLGSKSRYFRQRPKKTDSLRVSILRDGSGSLAPPRAKVSVSPIRTIFCLGPGPRTLFCAAPWKTTGRH